LIASVASGVPRIDWLGQSCPALLVEPSAQNQALWSRDLSVSGTWAASGITAVRNAVGADGAASGSTTLTSTAASATITQNISHASQSRIFSAYMRRVSGTGQIQLTTNGGTNWQTVTLTSAFAPFNSGAQTVASGQVGIRMIASGDVIEVDFTQAEVGPVPTSPIPTTTAAVSRAADVISASGALVSGLIGQTEGTMYFEVSDIKGVITGTGNPALMIRNSAFTNWIGLTSNIIAAPFRITVRSTTTTLINYTSAISEGKVAIAYSANGAVVYVNGSEVASTATNPNLTLNIVAMEQYMPFKVESLALYTTRLTDAQLAELTRL
jgi:hypothetical protein